MGGGGCQLFTSDVHENVYCTYNHSYTYVYKYLNACAYARVFEQDLYVCNGTVTVYSVKSAREA